MQTVICGGCTYEIENGEVFVIKTRHNRTLSGTEGNTWRQRITSKPKIRKLLQLAKLRSINEGNEPEVTDEMLKILSGPLPARRG